MIKVIGSLGDFPSSFLSVIFLKVTLAIDMYYT